MRFWCYTTFYCILPTRPCKTIPVSRRPPKTICQDSGSDQLFIKTMSPKDSQRFCKYHTLPLPFSFSPTRAFFLRYTLLWSHHRTSASLFKNNRFQRAMACTVNMCLHHQPTLETLSLTTKTFTPLAAKHTTLLHSAEQKKTKKRGGENKRSVLWVRLH